MLQLLRGSRSPWAILLLLTAMVGPVLRAEDVVLQAELAQRLKADSLTEGAEFVLQVSAPWQSAGCRLAPGVLLHAKVQSLSRFPGGHVQAFTFKLAAPCGDGQPLEFVVTSLLAPPKIDTVIEQFPGFGSIGGSTAQPQASPATFSGSDAMRGTAQAVNTTTVERNKLPSSVTLGEVWHLPHIRLTLPSGTDPVSTVATARAPLDLPDKTVFVLQRSRQEMQGVHALATGATPHSIRAPHVPKSFITSCSQGHCTVLPAAFPASGSGYGPSGGNLDLLRYGFRQEHDREVPDLELGTTVHFLGRTDLLLTFPTHSLVRRTGTERPTDKPLGVRALVVDLSTHAVERIEDWVIDDHDTYVWPAGDNLLVHQGQSLVLYGPGLQQIAVLPLTHPLFALRTSPDGEHILLGELNELHTGPEHQMLTEQDAHGPREEVLWSLLDRHLQPVRTLGSSSNFVPVPALLNDGIVDLRKSGQTEWPLLKRSWTGGPDLQLGNVHSACIPQFETTAPDLLAVTTCDASGSATHTFVVREDGAPVVEQTSLDQDLPVYAFGSARAAKLAMLRTRADATFTRGLLFHLSALKDQVIEVVSATDGEPSSVVPVPGIAYSNHAFALSPDGATLALVSGHSLTLYALRP